MKLRIVVAYDGTDFAGWQTQPNQRGVANLLQNRFHAVFKERIKLIGSSRTDAGVHALGQVAIFQTTLNLDLERIKEVWNNALPSSIVIRSIDHCPDDFHPRYDVTQKTYHYHFFDLRPLPFVQRYGFFFQERVDFEKLKNALAIFEGTHDFRSFCTGDETESTIRTIDEICLEFNQSLNAHRIVFKGKGFLRYLIRRIVGACLYVSSKKELDITMLQRALDEKNSNQPLPKAEAQGLMLVQIDY